MAKNITIQTILPNGEIHFSPFTPTEWAEPSESSDIFRERPVPKAIRHTTSVVMGGTFGGMALFVPGAAAAEMASDAIEAGMNLGGLVDREVRTLEIVPKMAGGVDLASDHLEDTRGFVVAGQDTLFGSFNEQTGHFQIAFPLQDYANPDTVVETQMYPNPSGSQGCTIQFNNIFDGPANYTVYNVLGQEVGSRNISDHLPSGVHNELILMSDFERESNSGRPFAKGVYFVHLELPGQQPIICEMTYRPDLAIGAPAMVSTSAGLGADGKSVDLSQPLKVGIMDPSGLVTAEYAWTRMPENGKGVIELDVGYTAGKIEDVMQKEAYGITGQDLLKALHDADYRDQMLDRFLDWQTQNGTPVAAMKTAVAMQDGSDSTGLDQTVSDFTQGVEGEPTPPEFVPPNPVQFAEAGGDTLVSGFYHPNLDADGSIAEGASDHIDFQTFFEFADAFGNAIGDEKYKAVFDYNHSGNVDFLDFFIFASLFNKPYIPEIVEAPTLTPILPENRADGVRFEENRGDVRGWESYRIQYRVEDIGGGNGFVTSRIEDVNRRGVLPGQTLTATATAINGFRGEFLSRRVELPSFTNPEIPVFEQTIAANYDRSDGQDEPIVTLNVETASYFASTPDEQFDASVFVGIADGEPVEGEPIAYREVPLADFNADAEAFLGGVHDGQELRIRTEVSDGAEYIDFFQLNHRPQVNNLFLNRQAVRAITTNGNTNRPELMAKNFFVDPRGGRWDPDRESTSGPDFEWTIERPDGTVEELPGVFRDSAGRTRYITSNHLDDLQLIAAERGINWWDAKIGFNAYTDDGKVRTNTPLAPEYFFPTTNVQVLAEDQTTQLDALPAMGGSYLVKINYPTGSGGIRFGLFDVETGRQIQTSHGGFVPWLADDGRSLGGNRSDTRRFNIDEQLEFGREYEVRVFSENPDEPARYGNGAPVVGAPDADGNRPLFAAQRIMSTADVFGPAPLIADGSLREHIAADGSPLTVNTFDEEIATLDGRLEKLDADGNVESTTTMALGEVVDGISLRYGLRADASIDSTRIVMEHDGLENGSRYRFVGTAADAHGNSTEFTNDFTTQNLDPVAINMSGLFDDSYRQGSSSFRSGQVVNNDNYTGRISADDENRAVIVNFGELNAPLSQVRISYQLEIDGVSTYGEIEVDRLGDIAHDADFTDIFRARRNNSASQTDAGTVRWSSPLSWLHGPMVDARLIDGTYPNVYRPRVSNPNDQEPNDWEGRDFNLTLRVEKFGELVSEETWSGKYDVFDRPQPENSGPSYSFSTVDNQGKFSWSASDDDGVRDPSVTVRDPNGNIVHTGDSQGLQSFDPDGTFGTYTVELSATDGKGETTSQTFNYQVSQGTTVTFLKSGSTVSNATTVVDERDNTFRASVSGSGAFTATFTPDIDDSDGTFDVPINGDFTHKYTTPGTFTSRLTVNGPDNFIETQDYTVTVASNDAPTVDMKLKNGANTFADNAAGPIVRGQTMTLDLLASVDPNTNGANDGIASNGVDILITGTRGGSAATFVDLSNQSLSTYDFTLPSDADGIVNVQVTMRDNAGQTTVANLGSITVNQLLEYTVVDADGNAASGVKLKVGEGSVGSTEYTTDSNGKVSIPVPIQAYSDLKMQASWGNWVSPVDAAPGLKVHQGGGNYQSTVASDSDQTGLKLVVPLSSETASSLDTLTNQPVFEAKEREGDASPTYTFPGGWVNGSDGDIFSIIGDSNGEVRVYVTDNTGVVEDSATHDAVVAHLNSMYNHNSTQYITFVKETNPTGSSLPGVWIQDGSNGLSGWQIPQAGGMTAGDANGMDHSTNTVVQLKFTTNLADLSGSTNFIRTQLNAGAFGVQNDNLTEDQFLGTDSSTPYNSSTDTEQAARNLRIQNAVHAGEFIGDPNDYTDN